MRATGGFAHRIGEGATGEVFRGELDGAPIAVKCLKLRPENGLPGSLGELARRFRAEVDVLGAYKHPRLIQLRAYAVDDEHADVRFPFALVFEYLDGGSLADWLRGPGGEPAAKAHGDGSGLSPLERVDVLLGAGGGLAYLHGRREPGDLGADLPVVHRDVKSANIGLAVQGGGIYAKLYDCGLAKAMRRETLAGPGGVGTAAAASFTGGIGAGTPGYMAPEVSNGIYTLRSEVYSFGVVLLEVLIGRRVAPSTASDVRDGVEDNGPGWLTARADPACDWPLRGKELLGALALECVRCRQDRRPADMTVVIDRLRAVRAVVDAAGAVPLRACVVCLEVVAACGGIACMDSPGPASHFVCLGCLPSIVEFNLEPRRLTEHAGAVGCPGEGCGHRWAIEDLAAALDKPTLVAWGRALRYHAFDAARARRDAEEALAAREAAARDTRLALAERARQYRAVIAERDLLLRCPRCAASFDEYDACNALTCGSCGAGFCAVCLADCGACAHAHYVAAHEGDVFNKPLFEETHRRRRTRLVISALRALAGDGAALQRAVLTELATDLRGLRIDEREVVRAVLGEAAVAARGEGDIMEALVADLRCEDPSTQFAAAVKLAEFATQSGARLRRGRSRLLTQNSWNLVAT